MQIASHSLISEQAKFDLGANICLNAAATAFRLDCRITNGTPFQPQNVYRNGVPVRSGTTTPLLCTGKYPLVLFDQTLVYSRVGNCI